MVEAVDLTHSSDSLPADVARDLARLADLLHPVPGELRQLDGSHRLTRVSDWLYGNWYTQQPDTLSIEQPEPPPADLRAALALATSASRRWRRGWVVLDANPSGICLAGLKQVNRWLRPGQYANIARPGLPLAPGDALSVVELIDDVDEATGFWVSQSAPAPAPPLMRLYFNAGWRQAGPVLNEVTAWLDTTAAAYSLKYPIRPVLTHRVDTLVVYLERAQWAALESAAMALALRIGQHLRTPTPPLTRRLAPGVGCADDPGTKASFGQSRCAALASAVLQLIEAGLTDRQNTIAALTAALASASIDPQKPWHVAPA